MIKRVILVSPLVVCAAFGQLTSNSVTVTASRNISNVQPDQVIFGVTVDSPLTASREDAIAALDGSSITVANFSGVGIIQLPSQQQGTKPQSVLEWRFSLPVPIANLKSTVGLLTAVQASNAKQNNGFTIAFGISGTQVSQQAQQSQQCAQADLLADARAQAQKMATAASMSLGAVLAMSSSSLATTDASAGLFSSPAYAPVCSLTVKFALGAF